MDGVIDPYVVRVWHTQADEMTCPTCRPMNAQRAAVGRPYTKRPLKGPPAHPNCRCWETLERGPVLIAKDEPHLGSDFKYRHIVETNHAH